MKKIMFCLAVVAMMLAITTACVEPLLEKPAVATKTTTFRAILEGGGVKTKTVLGEKNNDGYYPVYWSEGDSIKVVTVQYAVSGGQGTSMKLISGAGTNDGVFEGDIPQQTGEFRYYYAIYPHNVSASIGNMIENWGEEEEHVWEGWECPKSVEILLPSVQKYAPHSFAKNYNPALAVTMDQTLRFKNLCGLLQFNFTGNVKVSRITVEDLGGANLWGTAKASYRWKPETGDQQFAMVVNNQFNSLNGYHPNTSIQPQRNVLTLICETPVELSAQATDFYLAIPEPCAPYWEPSIPLSKGFIITVYDENGKEVFTQKTTEDNSIRRSIVREMPVVDIQSKTLTDLSANGGANCYIVKPDGGTYRFYAGYRGSSTYPVPTAANVEVLWETKNSDEEAPGIRGIIENGVYNPETGYISFKTTSTPGNALIALRDAQDNVLWSWHIWVTDYDPDASGATSIVNGSYEFMNWDLGAISGTERGIPYQWGRKDPFPRDFQLSPSEPFNSIQEGDSMGGVDALTYSIEHPTTVINEGPEWCDWDPGQYLWGKQKTAYDPCPPGWQVMDFDVFQSINHCIITDQHNWNADDVPWGYRGFMLYDSEPDLWFPGEGYWTNRHTQIIGAFSVRGDNFFTDYAGCLLPVRCQRSSTVRELRPVIDLSENGTANSYIVQPDKRYKFNATVKGNTLESVGTIASIQYGYETENNAVTQGSPGEESVVSDVYLKDGYIYFTTSLSCHHGNATIIAKDIHERVLWSWHIWCPEIDPEQGTYTFNGGDGVTLEMMPLNLGALNNTPGTSESLGLMYQWGRKDPFLCARAWDSNAQAEYWGSQESVDASAETSTLDYAIKNPTSFIEGSANWLAEAINGLWGPTKTMYDPCPPGWKVPSRPVWASTPSVTAEFDSVNKGLTMGGNWYPAAGFRHNESFNLHNVGLEGHYWYATPYDDGTANAFYFSQEGSSPTIVELNTHADKKAQANSVRCVKE